MCILAQLSDPYVRSAQTKQSIAVRRHCVARQGARSATAACQSLERGLGCTAVSMHAVDSAAVLLRSACTVQCTYESLSSKLQRTTQHSIIALPLFATDDGTHDNQANLENASLGGFRQSANRGVRSHACVCSTHNAHEIACRGSAPVRIIQ